MVDATDEFAFPETAQYLFQLLTEPTLVRRRVPICVAFSKADLLCATSNVTIKAKLERFMFVFCSSLFLCVACFVFLFVLLCGISQDFFCLGFVSLVTDTETLVAVCKVHYRTSRTTVTKISIVKRSVKPTHHFDLKI